MKGNSVKKHRVFKILGGSGREPCCVVPDEGLSEPRPCQYKFRIQNHQAAGELPFSTSMLTTGYIHILKKRTLMYTLYHKQLLTQTIDLNVKFIYFCFTDYTKVFDCVDHNKLWKTLKEMRISGHLTCLLRTCTQVKKQVTSRHGTTDWFKTGKGVQQNCLSLCLFNL